MALAWGLAALTDLSMGAQTGLYERGLAILAVAFICTVPIAWFVQFRDKQERYKADNALYGNITALRQDVAEANARDLHNVRAKAQELATELHTRTYELAQTRADAPYAEKIAYQDKMLTLAHAFEQHTVTDHELKTMFSAGIIDLSAYAHALDGLIRKADKLASPFARLEAKAKSDLRREAKEKAHILFSARSEFGIKRAETLAGAGAQSEAAHYMVALADISARVDLQRHAYAIEEIFENFERYGVVPRQRPPVEWIRSPSTMDQVAAVEACLTEMADELS